jgi:Tfp pilus assembly protein PilN
MKDLSEQVPESAEFLLTTLVLDGDRIDIRGEAATADAAEAVKKALEATGRYASVAVSSSGGQAGRVEFELKTTMAKKP